ncbi:uncharacterized protein LOC135231330 [Loxodonta africana]|uniref:uncharacterized protein LOC135231330 n=1 Tax=Loxodonta africana TaxID=9785 RepID=UPI0030CE3B74
MGVKSDETRFYFSENEISLVSISQTLAQTFAVVAVAVAVVAVAGGIPLFAQTVLALFGEAQRVEMFYVALNLSYTAKFLRTWEAKLQSLKKVIIHKYTGIKGEIFSPFNSLQSSESSQLHLNVVWVCWSRKPVGEKGGGRKELLPLATGLRARGGGHCLEPRRSLSSHHLPPPSTPPRLRLGECRENKIATEAQNVERRATLQIIWSSPFVSRARSWRSGLTSGRASQRSAGTSTHGPACPAAEAPPQLPGRLASLFVLFLISPRPARAGLLAAVHLQQSRDQPISSLRSRSRRALEGGEAAEPRRGHLKAALASLSWAAPGAATNGSPPLFK